MIPQSVSKYTEVLELFVASSIMGSNVMAVVEYVYLLNTRLELRADNFAIEQKISLAEIRFMPVSTKTTKAGILQLNFI